jgi:mRNA-degrading endonuclease RelE of RelBE toxin-antitoxin system
LYRVRVGDYRIIYSISDSSVLVLKIGHRSDVYRDST